jgi:integrase
MADPIRVTGHPPTERHQNHGLRKVCDCGHTAWTRCGHGWFLNYKPKGGKAWRLSIDRVVGKHIQAKSDAKIEANKIKAAIDAGTFRQPVATAPTIAPVVVSLTLRDVAKKYLERYVHVPTRRKHAGYAIGLHVARIVDFPVPLTDTTTILLGDKAIDTITKADVEAIRDALRGEYARNRKAVILWEAFEALPLDERQKVKKAPTRPPRTMRAGLKLGEVGINRLLARLRHVFSWAIINDFTNKTPFKKDGQTAIKLEMKAETARTRRLQPGEEEALLAHAGNHLRGLVVAALSTGCREGELLGLQHRQIRRDEKGIARWIVLDASQTKTNQHRVIPIGPRLRAELDMRTTDPDGEPFKADDFVFGNEVGERIASIYTAWRATCRRAGVRNLTFHDLRREFGSRLMESGAPEHDVQAFLGHANITTTSRYLTSSALRLKSALARLQPEDDPEDDTSTESGHAHAATRGSSCH